jgi:hypothetical protein
MSNAHVRYFLSSLFASVTNNTQAVPRKQNGYTLHKRDVSEASKEMSDEHYSNQIDLKESGFKDVLL